MEGVLFSGDELNISAREKAFMQFVETTFVHTSTVK
jgi:hypothetical protein